MLVAGSSLEGTVIEASDGPIGSVRDVLFDDTGWAVRWLVVDTGHWLAGRHVLLHPSSAGEPDREGRRLPVSLTRAQVEASPDVARHQPVTLQMQDNLAAYYNLAQHAGSAAEDAAFHLRSMVLVRGYALRASDGDIGHLEDVLLDDAGWAVRYLVVNTRNWWPGASVLIAPQAVQAIDWGTHHVVLNVTRDQVKGSPPWDPAADTDPAYWQSLHDHYGWL